MDASKNPFFSASIRTRFRESLEIPCGVKMWIARYYGGPLRGDYTGYGFQTPILPDVEFYAFSYVVGYLVLQVLASRWVNSALEGKNLPSLLSPHPMWKPAVIQFWPNTGVMIKWPPSEEFDEQSLKDFCLRWQSPIAYKFG